MYELQINMKLRIKFVESMYNLKTSNENSILIWNELRPFKHRRGVQVTEAAKRQWCSDVTPNFL